MEEIDIEVKEGKDKSMHTPDRKKIGTPQRSRFEGSPTHCIINDFSPIQPVEPKDDEHMFQSPSFASVDLDFSSPKASIFFRGHSISLQRDVSPEDFHGSSPIAREIQKEIYSFDKTIMECFDSPARLTQSVQFECNKEIISSLEAEHNIGNDDIQTLVEVQIEHYQATPNKEEESPRVRNRVKHLDKEEDGGRFCESDVMMLLPTSDPLVHDTLEEHAINHTSQTARHYNEAGKPNISISTDCKVSKDTQVETQHHGKRRWCLTVQNKVNRSIVNTNSFNQQQGNNLPPYMAPCIGMYSNTPAISQDLMSTDPFYSIIAGNSPFSMLFDVRQDKLPIGTEAQNTNTNIFEAPECGINKKLRQRTPRKK